MDTDCSKRYAGAVASLPDDPLVEILSRVPVKSVCRFKCVSKAWRDLIADPLHRKKLPQTLEGFFFDSDRCGDDGDDEDSSNDGGSGDNWPRLYGHFVDMLGRSVRPCFSFLTELPGNENIRLLHYCNGLLLFARPCTSDTSVSYIVCNPATEQWVAVPSSGRTSSLLLARCTFAYLVFDPANDSCFHLVQFWMEDDNKSVHTYSSNTGAWSHKKCDCCVWGYYRIAPNSPNAYVNGMLHLILYEGDDQLVSVDVEGNIQKIIPPPFQLGEECWPLSDYVGQSQGRLHYIYHEQEMFDLRCEQGRSNELLIWVLEDYDTQEWVLKDTVSFLKLFGKSECQMDTEYNVVAVHPDRNLIFLVQHWNRKLISYQMDSKEVCDLCTLGHGYRCIAPYVPYFLELSSLENKQ